MNGTSKEERRAAWAGVPACLRLLKGADLLILEAPLKLLCERREDVKRRWHQLRAAGPCSPPLSYRRFEELYGREFEAVVGALRHGNLGELAESVRRAGMRLEGHGIPFEDVVISLSHFEDCCRSVLGEGGVDGHDLDRVLEALVRLSHSRVALLSEAYFRSIRVRAGHGTWSLGPVVPGESAPGFQGLVGLSEAMRRVFDQLIAAGRSHGSVLIRGESGTGKELAARAIHRLSDRAGAPFVAVNCAALPREMIESELFGHCRGAFTGALHDHPGLFRAAGVGTLFLDEITEMSAETQGKLLRVLQEHVVRPVGAIEETPVGARVLASTNRDPQAAMGRGLLRADLYYRLQVHEIRMPSLRERPGDIPLLIDHFVRINNERYGRGVRGLSVAAQERSLRHPWPGNVRELMNALERAFSVVQGDRLDVGDLFPGADSGPAGLGGDEVELGRAPAAPRRESGGGVLGIVSFDEAERSLLRRALQSTGGNKARAARLLGISRKQLYAKITRFRLETPGRRSSM